MWILVCVVKWTLKKDWNFINLFTKQTITLYQINSILLFLSGKLHQNVYFDIGNMCAFSHMCGLKVFLPDIHFGRN